MNTRLQQIPEGIAVFTVVRNGQHVNCVSFEESQDAFTAGLAQEAIIGLVDSTLSLTPAHFKHNPAFRTVLHKVIERVAPNVHECKVEATKQQNGFVYILDARAKDLNGAVPPEDIMGRFQVQQGRIKPESYEINPNHLIVSERGLFRLPPYLHAELLKELKTYKPRR